jgi:hypothetical protein
MKVLFHIEGAMDQTAREELILSNQPLVFFIAKKYCVPGLPPSDLVQEGNIGIIHFVDTEVPWPGATIDGYPLRIPSGFRFWIHDG